MASKKIMVISVHPDDETIGCGGTILKHVNGGDEVAVTFVTDGNSTQKKLIDGIVSAYGMNDHFRLQLDEISLERQPLSDIIGEIANVFRIFQPNVVYLPNRSDVHSDHRRTFEACQACLKSFRFPFIDRALMAEVISETDFAPALPENVFMPNVFVDISKFFDRKIEIMKMFEAELLEDPYTRSLSAMEAYNRYRGSLINARYAEAFSLLKERI